MWQLVGKISSQVTKYSTWFGQLWYLCVFVFRLIVVATIGGAVYGDEQSAFTCSTQEPGCTNMCFNEFSKISHIRFWAFQLLAVATPVVIFHFYSVAVTGQIEKLKKAEPDDLENKVAKDKARRRIKSVGKIIVKEVFSEGNLKEVAVTNKIHYAYYITIVARLIIEAIFIHLSNGLFRFMDISSLYETGPFHFIWIRVPAMFSCTAQSPEVKAACHQAVGLNQKGHVPCWVSRPWEKTIFIRYMNVLSGICFLLCASELIYLTAKGVKKIMKKSQRLQVDYQKNDETRRDYVFYPPSPNAHIENETSRFTEPVYLSGRNPNERATVKKKVRVRDMDGIREGHYHGSSSSFMS